MDASEVGVMVSQDLPPLELLPTLGEWLAAPLDKYPWPKSSWFVPVADVRVVYEDGIADGRQVRNVRKMWVHGLAEVRENVPNKDRSWHVEVRLAKEGGFGVVVHQTLELHAASGNKAPDQNSFCPVTGFKRENGATILVVDLSEWRRIIDDARDGLGQSEPGSPKQMKKAG